MTRRGGGEDQLQSLAVRRRLCRVVESENEKPDQAGGGGRRERKLMPITYFTTEYGVRSTLLAFPCSLGRGHRFWGEH